jgi:MFS transporter, NNP family, nitrate/nitrite transporter
VLTQPSYLKMKVSYLWASPAINPINRKAHSIPLFNLVNVYGRVFFFSWWGFMIAFWAWYAFPPLVSVTAPIWSRTTRRLTHFQQLTHTIKANLGLSPAEVANSNIVSLCATYVSLKLRRRTRWYD